VDFHLLWCNLLCNISIYRCMHIIINSNIFFLKIKLCFKPGIRYPHVTWTHIKLTFYFQLLPYPFPCIGCHMLISIIWWLGVIQKRPLAHFYNKHFLHFLKQLVMSEERLTRMSRLTKCVRQQKFERHAGMWTDQRSTRDHSDRSVNLHHRIQC